MSANTFPGSRLLEGSPIGVTQTGRTPLLAYSDPTSEALLVTCCIFRFVVVTDGMTMETTEVLRFRLEGYYQGGSAIFPVGGPATNDLTVLHQLALNRTQYFTVSSIANDGSDADAVAGALCDHQADLEGWDLPSGSRASEPCGTDPEWCDKIYQYCSSQPVWDLCPMVCGACTSTTTTSSMTASTISTTALTSSTTVTTETTTTTAALMLRVTVAPTPIEDLFETLEGDERCNKFDTASHAPIFKLPGDGHTLIECAMACTNQSVCMAFVLSSSGFCHMFRKCNNRSIDGSATTMLRIEELEVLSESIMANDTHVFVLLTYHTAVPVGQANLQVQVRLDPRNMDTSPERLLLTSVDSVLPDHQGLWMGSIPIALSAQQMSLEIAELPI